jgi:hypothetical protein
VHAVSQESGGEKTDAHLDRHRDDEKEEGVPRGGTNRRIMEDVRVVGPADEWIGDTGEDMPVIKTDIKLTKNRVRDEQQVQERRGRQQEIRRGDPNRASAPT